MLEGEPGVGKSTLWLAAVEGARRRSYRLLTSRPAEAEQTLPFVVLGDLFGDVEAGLLSALPAPRRRAFEAALLREEPDMPIDPRALGVAIVTLLPSLAMSVPLMLAIDDDQWMDPSSVATLSFALRRSLNQPIVLLLSRRVGAPATALEAAIDPARIQRLRLGTLSLGAIQLLVRRRLGITFPRSKLLRLHESSGGNPFYALELARASSLDPLADPTLTLALPPNLDRLVAARLDSLDARTRAALLLVAAHGRLPVRLLPALAVPFEVLDQARRANVIDDSSEFVRFSHPLLAAGLYQGASSEERRTAHRTLAATFDDVVDRGRHLALGADEPDEQLAASLDSAVNAARDRGMPIAAAELAEHALRLTPPDVPERWHRRAIATAHAHLEAGDVNRARAIADDLVARAPSGARRAEALVLSSELADPGRAVDLLGDALAEAAAVPDLEASIHLALAGHGRMAKGRRWAEPHGEASLRLAEQLDDDVLRVRALMLQAELGFDRGEPGALELGERAYELATQLADPRLVKGVGLDLGFLLMFSGNLDRAREWLERQLVDWGDRDEQVRSGLLWCLALVEVWSGRWAIASEYADQVREIAHQYGEAPTDHLSPALIALHRGQIAIARDHSKRALALANGHLLPQHVAILGICDLWSGDTAAGYVGLRDAESTADARGWDDPNLRWWRGELVEALLQLGRIEEADHLRRDWEAAAARIGRPRVLAMAMRCQGLIAAARGDLSIAERLLEEAVDAHAAAGDPFGRTRALLSLGVVRLRARQKRTARAALGAAVLEFDRLGANAWAAAARAELARIGGRARIEGLSPSEIRVAGLVANGLTNREIAAALFLGERTVASHLTHIYAKLGIRSRTELAASVSAKGSEAADATKVPTS